MVSVLATSAIGRGFEPRSGQTKDIEIGIYMLSSSAVDSELDPNQGLYNWYIYALLECRR